VHLFKYFLKFLNGKEVKKMVEKKKNCGCGCLPLKKNSRKASKEKNKVDKSKKIFT
jgi:hypothetical protein